MKLDSAIETFVREREDLNRDSVRRWSLELELFKEQSGKAYLCELTREDVFAYRKWYKDHGRSDNTIALRTSSLFTFGTRFNVLLNLFTKNERKRLTLRTDGPVDYYTENDPYELKKFFAACDDEERLRFMFFLHTGARSPAYFNYRPISVLYLNHLSALMRYGTLSLELVLLLVGCSGPRIAGHSESEQRAAGEQNHVAAAVPASSQFSVNVRLSDAARKKLIDDKETIIVAGYFTGRPKPGTEARYLDIKSGDVILGDVKSEILPGETAIFGQLNLNPDALARIDSQGPILIDVFSGRRSSKDNLWIANITTAVSSRFMGEQSSSLVN